MILNEIKSCLESSNRVAIFTHINSDCDAIGSSIALKLALEQMGKKVQIFIEEPIHSNYDVLNIKKHVNVDIGGNFDLAVGLDAQNIKRFGIHWNKFRKIKKSINIDHHRENTKFATINYVKINSSSTCLLLYSLIKLLNVTITSEMALNLYLGISSDTGRFMYGELNSDVFKAVAELYDIGFDYLKANYMIFQHKSINEVKLFQAGLDRLEILLGGKLALICLTADILEKTNSKPQDTYILPDYIMGIDGVEIACILTENLKNEFLVSIRTRKKNAQVIAKYFGGGGHLRASGCRIFTDEFQAKQQLIRQCQLELNR